MSDPGSRGAGEPPQFDRPATGRSTIGSVLRSSPEALLLLAAGGALLFGAARRAAQAAPLGDRATSAGRSWKEAATEGVNSMAGSLASAGTRASQMAGSAADQVASTFASLSETTTAYAQVASEGMATVRDAIPEGVRLVQNAARPAEEAVSYFVNDQPILLAAIGLAAGAAIGAALPNSVLEDRLFGEARDRLAQKATEVASAQLDRLRRAQEAASEKLKEEAAERGLTPDGLKDVAKDVMSAAKEAAADKHEPARAAARSKS